MREFFFFNHLLLLFFSFLIFCYLIRFLSLCYQAEVIYFLKTNHCYLYTYFRQARWKLFHDRKWRLIIKYLITFPFFLHFFIFSHLICCRIYQNFCVLYSHIAHYVIGCWRKRKKRENKEILLCNINSIRWINFKAYFSIWHLVCLQIFKFCLSHFYIIVRK